ncbi:MFS transporter [Streptomyces violaceusniger]|uniref:Major facilitator superfamily MFS_1 n=1 Tax=Streptomyces violaceusniger (strain Tu 4113) TaxID=653045 RepID=G2P5B8_STRV4|nr:MFS transporter [Streptomyces violaceusniger]AEM84731.1 major facilitator superfamily MFS_1 [Streptomyces violaceusniger Tu 4113]
MTAAPPVSPPVPLSRNRDYRLLWGSQALSEFGFHAAVIAFPLLVLALTGSAAASGLVMGTIAAAQMVVGLPAGVLVDRYDRKAIMLGCEAAQAVSAISLVVAVWAGAASVWHMVAVAAVFGASAALFEPAENASLPTLVADDHLPTAVAMNTARASMGQLAGTATGGFLFAVGRFVPFLVDAVTHTLSFVALLFVRLPRRERPPGGVGPLGREALAGLRWVWRERRIRVTVACAVVLNLFFSAFYLVVIVLAESRGVPSGEVGVMAAMLGVGGVAGALVAPVLYRRLGSYGAIVAVFWALAVFAPVTVLVDSGYLIGVLFALMALFPPTANTAIMTDQLLRTPDELRGRLTSTLVLACGAAGAAGPALGGSLAQIVPGDRAILLCAMGMAAAAVLATASPTLRTLSRRHEEGQPTKAH